MLGKLIKYEFKSLVHDLGVLYLVWMSLTVLVSILSKGIFNVPELIETVFIVSWTISFIAALVMTMVVIIDRRFYKNFYGAEGYFTLSLPIKTSTHIWSKVITVTIWMLLVLLFGFVVMMIMTLTKDSLGVYHQIKIFINEQPAQARKLILFFLEFVILGIIYISRFVLKLLTCINISVQFSRFKTLLQGVFFILFTIVEIYATMLLIGNLSGKFALNVTMYENKVRIVEYGIVILILMQAVEFAIYFLASNYLMKNRLNLE